MSSGLSSVAQLCPTLWPHELLHSRLPCPSLCPRVCSNSYPLNQWWHPNILSSVFPFSSCLQSFPALGSFPMSRLFTSGGQSIRASASVLPVNIQDSFPLGLTGWISLLSKGLSRVFSNPTVQKHQDSTYHRATRPMHHNYWSPHTESLCSTTKEATAVKSRPTCHN